MNKKLLMALAAAALMITSKAQGTDGEAAPTDVVDGSNDGTVGNETDPPTLPAGTDDTTTEEATTGGTTPVVDDNMENMEGVDGDNDGATPVTESAPFDPEEIVNEGTDETNDMSTQPNDPHTGHTDENGEIPQADVGAHDGGDDEDHGGHFLGGSTIAASASALVVLASLLAM